MKNFYGGLFMNRENLKKEGKFYPIKLEYYKIKEEEKNIETYGIEVIKTEYGREDVKIEKANILKLTKNEDIANQILEILKMNEVTPISMHEVVQDLTKCW